MLLEVKNLTKSFGEKQVLKGISLSVQSGKAFGLLGRNGAGKTTAIRIIMDVFKPDSGEVLFDGMPRSGKNIRFGYLPEERGLYPKKLIGEQLIYFGELKGMKAGEAKKSVQKLLDRLDMGEYYNKRLDSLSKGNQQKIQLAAALISNPDIIILDEPFSGLDPVNAQTLKEIVKESIAEGKIVLFSSHQMNYVEEFCNEIAILNQGQIAISGNIKEIKRSYERNKIVITALPDALEKINGFISQHLSPIISDVKSDNNSLLVRLKNASDKGILLKSLAEQNLDFDGFNVYEPTLNDIFVQYTEDAV